MVVAVAVLALIEASALAGDDPYGRLVKNLEANYHARRISVPFMGLANFVLKFWHPAGVKSLKLTVFGEVSPLPDATGPSFDSALKAAVGPDWQPVVRVYSKADQQWVYVYLMEERKDVKILVATHSERQGVIAQVKFNPEKLAEFVQNPQILGVKLAREIEHGPDGKCSPAKAESDSK